MDLSIIAKLVEPPPTFFDQIVGIAAASYVIYWVLGAINAFYNRRGR